MFVTPPPPPQKKNQKKKQKQKTRIYIAEKSVPSIIKKSRFNLHSFIIMLETNFVSYISILGVFAVVADIMYYPGTKIT